jgi:hypothetical protein
MTARYQTVPETFPNMPDWMRRVAQCLNGVLLGRTNNVFTVTLTPSETTTTFSHDRITEETVAILVPLTATAAANIGGTTGIYQVPSAGQIIFNHQSTPQTDKTYRLVLIG